MIDTLVKRYIAGLKRDWYKHGNGTSLTRTWVTNEGRKYIKISSGYVEDGEVVSESVNAFVDKNTGDVFMPASWNAPAKGVRYNLFDDIDYLEKNCGSGHLYMK